jgi:hypothetical protein
MENTYAVRIQKIIDNPPTNPASEHFMEMVNFLDKNFPALKTIPKTIPYPPPMGYGSFGKDITNAVLYETFTAFSL